MGRALHVKRNDQVVVISGDHKGKRGRILKVVPDSGKVIVEGVNYVWKHVKPSQKSPRGGRLQIEAPLDASNVMLICSNRNCSAYEKAVRTKSARLPDGTKVRGCAKCGSEIAGRAE